MNLRTAHLRLILPLPMLAATSGCFTIPYEDAATAHVSAVRTTPTSIAAAKLDAYLQIKPFDASAFGRVKSPTDWGVRYDLRPFGQRLQTAISSALRDKRVFSKLIASGSSRAEAQLILSGSVVDLQMRQDLKNAGFTFLRRSASATVAVRLLDAHSQAVVWETRIKGEAQNPSTDHARVMADLAETIAQRLVAQLADNTDIRRAVAKLRPLPAATPPLQVAPPPAVVAEPKQRPRPLPHREIRGQRWAVVIGVSKYRDNRVPRIDFAARDASTLHEWLVSPAGGGYAPERTLLLVNEDATAQGIREALFEWLTQPIAEDTVVIYFAGHASPQSPDNPDNLFLLPHDVDYEKVASTAFPMWDVRTALQRFLKAQTVVIITDACHAAGVGHEFDIARRAGRGLKVVGANKALHALSSIAKGICVLTASAEDQYSQEGKQWGGGHGVFTFFLLRGLQGGADYSGDGRVTVGELVPFLSENVRRATRSAQCPKVAGDYDPALQLAE